jgi:hypothetical protein
VTLPVLTVRRVTTNVRAHGHACKREIAPTIRSVDLEEEYIRHMKAFHRGRGTESS